METAICIRHYLKSPMPQTSGYRRNRGSRERNQDVRLKTDAVAQQHNECLKYDEYRADTLHRYVICQAEQGNRANVRAHRMLSTKCCLPQQSSSVHPSALGHFRVSASATGGLSGQAKYEQNASQHDPVVQPVSAHTLVGALLIGVKPSGQAYDEHSSSQHRSVVHPESAHMVVLAANIGVKLLGQGWYEQNASQHCVTLHGSPSHGTSLASGIGVVPFGHATALQYIA